MEILLQSMKYWNRHGEVSSKESFYGTVSSMLYLNWAYTSYAKFISIVNSSRAVGATLRAVLFAGELGGDIQGSTQK